MMGLVQGEGGRMPPEQAMRGCLMLSVSLAVLLIGSGAFIWFLNQSGCIGSQ